MALTTVKAGRTEDFLSTLGVNTHVIFSGTTYSNTSAVLADLRYVGISKVRDQLPPSDSNFWGPYKTLMAAGIKFDLVVPNMQTTISSNISTVDSLVKAYPNGVLAIEGLNEIDGLPSFSYAGKTGLAAATAYQTALYNAVQSDSLLNSVAVYNMSLRQGGDHTALPNQSGSSDYGNAHIYFMWVPPSWNLSNQLAADRVNNPGQPVVITETGYTTISADDGSHSGFVNEAVQARFILDDFLDAYSLGVSTTYVYELMDEAADPGQTNHEMHWGLFRADGTAKPAAVALHNLTTILADSGSQTFTTGSLTYGLSNLPSASNSLVLEKSNGSYDLVVWAEPQLWNGKTNTPYSITPSTVTVTFDRAYASVLVYDPLVGSNAIQKLSNARSLTISVSDHPVIVEVSAGTGSGSTGTGGSSSSGGGTSGSSGGTSTDSTGTTSAPQTAQTYKLTSGIATLTGTTANDTFVATGGTLNAGDVLDGGGGLDTLSLQGGGVFDLRLPTTFSNIEVISAAEGEAASGSIAGTDQTVYLRPGTAATVNVAANPSPNASNPNPDTITIYGADNSDMINLGPGNDIFYLGGAGETVNGSSGRATIYANADTIGATIHAGSGSTTLFFTGAGNATMGSNIVGIDTVVLSASTTSTTDFTANATANMTIRSSPGDNRITVGNASQTVIANTSSGHGSTRVLASADNAGVNFVSTGASMLEITTGGTATLNPNLQGVLVKLDTATTLWASKMSFLTIDASSGGSIVHTQAAGQTVIAGPNSTLDDANRLGATFQGMSSFFAGVDINDFNTLDNIYLTDMNAGSAKVSYSGSGSAGTLNVSDGTHSATIGLTGALSGGSFHVAASGSGSQIAYY